MRNWSVQFIVQSKLIKKTAGGKGGKDIIESDDSDDSILCAGEEQSQMTNVRIEGHQQWSSKNLLRLEHLVPAMIFQELWSLYPLGSNCCCKERDTNGTAMIVCILIVAIGKSSKKN